MATTIERKTRAAEEILQSCLGTNGVHADQTRHQNQCWTRVFCMGVLPLLLKRKQFDVARRHLTELSKRQRPNGQIPLLFLDKTLPFLTGEILTSIKERKASPVLGRFLTGNLWNLTPGTHDSEIHYIIAMHEFDRAAATEHALLTKYLPQLNKALRYIEHTLMYDGMVRGCDWRDAMHEELKDASLLTNNALLYHAYHLIHQTTKAHHLRLRIDHQFWNGAVCKDAPNRPRFDPLGGALAVIHDAIGKEHYKDLVKNFRAMDSTNGVTVKYKPIALDQSEQAVVLETNGVIVCPFVIGFTVLALLKMGEYEFAEEQFIKLCDLNGFQEWYHPGTGRGYGTHKQLLSAALFLRAHEAISREREKHTN